MRGSRRRTRGAANINRAMRQAKREEAGHNTHPSRTPNQITPVPWNSACLEFRLTNSGSQATTLQIFVGDVIAELIARFALKDDADVRVRIQDAKGWNIATAQKDGPPELKATFYELSGESAVTGENYPRSIQVNHGTLSQGAVCGYKFTAADRREVFGTTATVPIMLLEVPKNPITVSNDETVLARINILYQVQPAPTKILSYMRPQGAWTHIQ